jgi:hypothetical protein
MLADLAEERMPTETNVRGMFSGFATATCGVRWSSVKAGRRRRAAWSTVTAARRAG